MRSYVACLGIISSLFSLAEATEELELPMSTLLLAPEAGLNQLDFLGKPQVKKLKQAAYAYRSMIKHGHAQDPSIDCRWGLRTGLGWSSALENLNVVATHTKFHTKGFSGVATPSGVVMPGQGQESAGFVGWRLHLDLADLEVGRRLQVMEKVSLRPHLGLRAAWIYQKRKMVELESDEVSSRRQPLFCSNNCLGLGGRAGVDSLWNVKNGLSFFGDGALSMLAGYYNIDRGQMLEGDNSVSNGIATAEVSLGMQYETFVSTKRRLTIRMGYEMNYIFNQTRWGDWFTNAQGALSDVTSGMSLQGVTIGFRLNY